MLREDENKKKTKNKRKNPDDASSEINEDSDELDSVDEPELEEISLEDSKKKKGKKSHKVNKIVINLINTQYDIMKTVFGDYFKYDLILEEEEERDFDLYWADTGVTSEIVSKLKPYQKINHFPGMACLARKNQLGRNLMRIRKVLTKEYSFFPLTWMIPLELNEFKAHLKKNRVFIIKPEALSQGKGISLINSCEDIDLDQKYVVQRYINKPYLIEGLKFDLRIYVLLCGCDPLRIYIYNEGLARLATEPYEPPSPSNFDELCMHLTNYAINKDSYKFEFNTDANKTDVGHKRSLSFVLKYIDEHGGNSEKLLSIIKKMIVKTLCSVQPILAHTYRSCLPNDLTNNQCFEILGFDILIDHKLKPWLLEVNHSPSFTTDTPFDVKIKSDLIKDTINLIHIDINKREKYYLKLKEINQKRLEGKKFSKINKEVRQEKKEKKAKKRDEYEKLQVTQFTLIYPDEKEDYEKFIEIATEIWDEFTGGKKKKKIEKEEKEVKKICKKIPNKIQNNQVKPSINNQNIVRRENDKHVKKSETKETLTPYNLFLNEQIPHNLSHNYYNSNSKTTNSQSSLNSAEILNAKNNEILNYLSTIQERNEFFKNEDEYQEEIPKEEYKRELFAPKYTNISKMIRDNTNLINQRKSSAENSNRYLNSETIIHRGQLPLVVMRSKRDQEDFQLINNQNSESNKPKFMFSNFNNKRDNSDDHIKFENRIDEFMLPKIKSPKINMQGNYIVPKLLDFCPHVGLAPIHLGNKNEKRNFKK